MIIHPLSESQRESILWRHAKTMAARRTAVERGDLEAARRLLSEAQSVGQGYWDGLPRMAMSCCPFDNQPLIRSFDPFGLDGLWWRQAATRPNPVPCTHFCVLRGAVNFNSLPPQGGLFEAHTGPEVPYVIPRLLQLPTMVAVIGELPMHSGYTAYLIAYFAQKRPPVRELTSDWPDNIFYYTSETGEQAWRAASDSWDFELMSWLKQGLVLWCPPGSDNRALNPDPSDRCPYLHLKGKREPIVVEENRFWTNELPGS